LVSDSFAVKLLQRVEKHGSFAPGRRGRPRGGRLVPFEAYLIREVQTQPDFTMPELARRLLAAHEVQADPAELSRFLCRLGFTYKKLFWHRNANALTSQKPGNDGGNHVSHGCANNPVALSLSTKHPSPPK